ncbi:MAG: hypothetical protein GX811_12520 [Lentisphaerae bacterium]|nr:hypothetical protein [Lentisphaerota bacterium]
MKTRKITPADRIELSFLESLAARCPDDIMILKALADLYTRVGYIEKGSEIDVELVNLCPDDPIVRYNYACSCALSGQADEALSSLEKAIELGYNDHEWMLNDPDLESLKSSRQFARLLKQITG